MLKLISAEHGRFGVIRKYHHAKLGRVVVVATWRDAGAEILQINIEKRPWPQKWKECSRTVASRHKPNPDPCTAHHQRRCKP